MPELTDLRGNDHTRSLIIVAEVHDKEGQSSAARADCCPGWRYGIGRRLREHVSMNDRVSAWLDSLGLAHYCEAFAQHAITWDVLPELTDEDLTSLGYCSAIGRSSGAPSQNWSNKERAITQRRNPLRLLIPSLRLCLVERWPNGAN